jgi:hypothetical protein
MVEESSSGHGSGDFSIGGGSSKIHTIGDGLE